MKRPEKHRDRAALVREWVGVLREYGMTFLALGVAAMLAGAVRYGINREVDDLVRWLVSGGLIAVAVYVLLRPDDLRRVFSGRSARYGSNALVLSLATIGIVVLLNYMSNRYYKRFDVTAARLHSLSPQSLQVLEGLDKEIEIIGLYPNGQGQKKFEQWLDEYRAHTDKISYRTLDPIRQPGEAEKLGWDGYAGGLIVRRGDKSQMVYTADEQNITSAILKVSSDKEKVLYFLTGHSERSPNDYAGSGYGEIGALLRDNNYQVRLLNLAITDTVPADASVVIVLGPRSALLDDEKKRLTEYLESGGKAMIMADPGVDTGINDVLAPWRVRVENMLVIDTWKGLSGDPVTPVIDRYRFSQITKDLPMVALPLACPIRQVEQVPDVVFTPLAQTSPGGRSWAESDMDNLEKARYDEGKDLPGPLTLIATVESGKEAPKTRMVLIGDTDLCSNDILNQIPNGRFLFLNAVNWLAEEESLIAIGPKVNVPRNVYLNAVQEGAVCFGTLIFIPGVILIAGVVVWLRRR